MFCSKCGFNNKNEDKFCVNCGYEIIKKKDYKKYIILILLLVIIIMLLISSLLIVKNNGPNSVSRSIMIYMDGSNLESDNKIATSDLDGISPSKVDLENVNVYLYTGGTKKWFNFVSSEENAIYKLTEDGFKKEKIYSKKNMGDPDTLSEFLTYVYKNSKTDKYDLVLYDHGGATDGAIYDDFTDDNLSLTDFKKALELSPFNKRNKLETVLFRTCLNATIEVANSFKNYADYMVASEEVTKGSSKTSVLNYINDITKDDTAITYSKKFISAYEKQMKDIDPFGFSTNSMYSIINLNIVDEFNDAFDEYIGGVELKNNYNNIVRLRSNLFQFATSADDNDYDTVDLYNLIVGLEPYTKIKSTKVKQLYTKLISYNWSSIDEAKGISIYFPYNGSESAQKVLMSVYGDLTYSNNYKKLITSFKDMHENGTVTSFSSKLFNNNISVNKKEFSLELTNEQANDYADSIYTIFKKEKDGKFTLIYSSDNTKLKNNILKTNISDNLLKVKIDEEDEYFYIPLVERKKDNKKQISFGGILQNYTNGVDLKSARWYVGYDKKNKPYVSNVIIKDDKEKGIGGAVADLDKYTSYSILSSHYQILDNNGNYTDNWDNNGIIQGYEFKKDEFILEKASLDDNGEYYCIFKIRDIYGKTYYSKLMNLENKE